MRYMKRAEAKKQTDSLVRMNLSDRGILLLRRMQYGALTLTILALILAIFLELSPLVRSLWLLLPLYASALLIIQVNERYSGIIDLLRKSKVSGRVSVAARRRAVVQFGQALLMTIVIALILLLVPRSAL